MAGGTRRSGGALRLPNNAFKKNAGTEVTTDILIFRKKDGQAFKAGNTFTHLSGTETHDKRPVEINEYYTANPDMMLGRMSLEGTMYGDRDQRALLPHSGKELGPQMVEAFGKLPGNVFGSDPTVNDFTAPVEAEPGMRENTLIQREGRILTVKDGALVDPAYKADAHRKRVKEYMPLKEAAQRVHRIQLDPASTDADFDAARKELNRIYDAYVKKHGPVSGSKNNFLWELDNEFRDVLALENVETRFEQEVDKDGVIQSKKKVYTSKSDVLSKRTIRPRQAPDKADTVGGCPSNQP